MQENRDYVIIDPKDGYEKEGELATVKLIDGEFLGTEYSYGVVSLDPSEEEDTLNVKFEYTIHTDNKNVILSEENIKEKFEIVISDVLNSILESTVEKAEEKYNNELREENS